MSDVQVVVTDSLPADVPYAAEFGRGDIRIAVRPMSQADTCAAIEAALNTMLSCYDPAVLDAMRATCRPLHRIA